MTTTTIETPTTGNETPPIIGSPVVVNPPAQNVIVVPPRILDASDKRKDWALWIITGGGMSMTLYALWALYLVQSNVKYVYYLGVAAMINIFVLFGAIAGLLVRRTVNISKNGLIMEDHDNNDKQG